MMKKKVQPEVNIGMVGHVDHGKTSLTKALSGVWTDTHSEEIKRGISIRLGYADTAFYKCKKCDDPECYTVKEKCPVDGSKTEFLRAVSFVDSPGHETLMATMLSGAALMDGALLLIAANEKCPQTQTKEHLMGLQTSGIDNIIVVQNKIDIVDREGIIANHKEIDDFIRNALGRSVPIIPVSAHHDANLDVLIQAIEEHIPTPKMKTDLPGRMFVARSFDVNNPGVKPKDLRGGVIGGTLTQGAFKVGDEIEIAPGFKNDMGGGKIEWENIQTTITSIFTGGKSQDEVKPGGLAAIGTNLDPALTKSDSLTGKIIALPGTLPPVWESCSMTLHLLDNVVGSHDDLKVDDIKTSEPLMLNVGTSTTVGIVTSARTSKAEVSLKIPICAEVGQRIAISRRFGSKWRLIGYGILG